ncbi:exodeoxyribonuclease VII large subunit [Clostridium bornimense]|uniref:exodeoxyribonuclease VII large subunit n=1 Tax=Clostridium bornimense TaxID=1216932 RepID=UPI001C11EF77|nr:exodeoxyribonuclease VII large subunit [Clostridium bornimense]MBU5315829.1 exodeoxyribonuclease VII large subunit [Clostridium bornimense]
MFLKVLTVTEVNNYIKKVFDNDFILKNSKIKGELSNVKVHSSGHIYFSLKDEGGKINGIMFSNYAEDLKIIPEEGMQVVISGKISSYPKDGSYTIYAKEMEVEGVGELHKAFEKLKLDLMEEGLFEEKYKKAIPKYPGRIGVITSPTGAAVRDVINVSTRRNEKVDILIYPCLVQGVNAPQTIIQGIETLDAREDIDVILLCRGGGSIEELWAFNDKDLARAIFNCDTPIVSAVGHEVDFTISDFVADLRGATPSQGAEIIVPQLREMEDYLNDCSDKLKSNITSYIRDKKSIISQNKERLKRYSPINKIIQRKEKVEYLNNNLNIYIKHYVENRKRKLASMVDLIEANSPMNIIKKGYGCIESDGKVISSIDTLKKKDTVKITLKDGSEYFDIKVRKE